MTIKQAIKYKAIYISIKPQYTKLIVSAKKNHEFRSYIPKQDFDTLFVYESSPVSALKYIIKIKEIILHPKQIEISGIGNEDFNQGIKTGKYAYRIKEVYELKLSLSLKDLKKNYGFSPPQAFAYASRYPCLSDYLETAEKYKLDL